MSYLPLLTEDEVRFVCSIIHSDYVTDYLQHHPKELAKIRPGFRAKALTKNEVSKLLFNFRARDSISGIIERSIGVWLIQIKEHYDQRVAEGEDGELALLHTLSVCLFADNIAIYFKLIGEERPDNEIVLINAAIKAIREVTEKQKSLEKNLKTKETEIETLVTKCEALKSELKDVVDRQHQRVEEVATLRLEMAELEELRTRIRDMEAEVELHKSCSQKHAQNIKGLKEELSAAIGDRRLLEEQIKEELEMRRISEEAQRLLTARPKKPIDTTHFTEYLGYNLTSLGVPNNSEYYHLLIEHLCKICFAGSPIVVNRLTGMNLAKCVANTLTGSAGFKTLVYRKDASNDEISVFLSSAGRIACLDNFIGNCNETELLSVLDRHKDKIIFLTIAYDRTIRYVSDEFLRYCHYLNLNRIAALSGSTELTEDPSTLEEVEYVPLSLSPDNRYASFMKQILHEVDYCKSLIEQKSAEISDEQDLCGAMAFDILPYCVDVLQITPYNESERLIKYAGDMGRCPYGKLLKEWFAR